ncbi:hypothetical protein E3P77_00810 [Wallemia ichthyophaga]|uniref:Uncharacterized protein n=1 Tax=Wallemia ichthyophaga TaxID=245174 RepID=A0A4T0LHQ0_WALIC|nr:hypothetical protein E3P86_01612 [Wallemia ichthyophaga]TIB68897.1 hypothetical protein E3P77_00810 [Wallemia ichthyophaga]
MTGQLRYDYFQTNGSLEVSVFAKGVSQDGLTVEFKERELFVNLSDNRQLHLAPLLYPIQPSKCSYTLKSMKIEIELVKAVEGVHWSGLTQPADTQPQQHPTNTKDWNKIAIEQDKEEKEDKNQDTNPDDFFKKLFAGADDDVRKAMMKSYQESGGTTLSTNWDEVKKGEVKGTPPEGMERKDY